MKLGRSSFVGGRFSAATPFGDGPTNGVNAGGIDADVKTDAGDYGLFGQVAASHRPRWTHRRRLEQGERFLAEDDRNIGGARRLALGCQLSPQDAFGPTIENDVMHRQEQEMFVWILPP